MEEGNNFFNEKKYDEAIVQYKKVLSSDVADSIKYNACLKLFKTHEDSGNRENGMYYLVRSYNYDKTRVEGIYNLIVHYCCEGQNEIAHYYYDFIKGWYEINYQQDFSGHPDKDIYDFLLPYYMIIVSQRIGRMDTAAFVSKVLCTKKAKNISQWHIRNLVFNIQFSIKHIDIQLLQSYITFLVDSGVDITTVSSISVLEKHGIIFNLPPKFTQEQCKNSKNIIFYTGFANPWWNYSYSIANALGGSETAVAYLATCFPKDYTIYVTGEVHEETVGNVKYVHLQNVQNLLNETPMHTVVISRYIAFFEMFKFWSYQTFVWAHDTALIHYGCDMNVPQILDKWHTKINGVICLTQWHKELFQCHYPQIADKIHIINNGIKDDLFNIDIPKIKNSFVYTSCSNRGLKRLLELWSQIIERIPDATLRLASYVPFPNTDDDNKMNEYIKKTPSITHLGKLGSRELYETISSSEYWLYPTCWHETSCITALEMMRCGVICIYYPVAGLPYTMENNGFAVKEGEEIETIIRLTDTDKLKQIENGKNYVNTCSWKDRYSLWDDLIFGSKIFPIKIVNLERRTDRKTAMIEKMRSSGISNYEFIKAVDGKNMTFTREIYDLFSGNDFCFRKGVIGCALSHFNIWKELINNTYADSYIIFEDDVIVSDKLCKKLEYCCNEIRKNNLEFVYFGMQLFNKEKLTTLNNDISEIKFEKIDMSYTHDRGAFGYIISKSAAKKLVDYLSKNHIKHAIDKSLIFHYSGVDTYNTTVALVGACVCKTASDNVDSDIQDGSGDHYTDHFNIFKFVNTKYIAFCDWWVEEYCGGDFNKEDNFLTNMLRKHSGLEICVVDPSDNPDVLFFSMFDNKHNQYSSKRKVFFIGEPYPERSDADYNITFDKDSAKNTRIPLWVCYMNNELLNERVAPSNKREFCSFIASNPGHDNIRKNLVEALTKYKQVDCGGPYLNNIGIVIPRGKDASGKICFNKQFKFGFAIENKNTYEGYCTEKILDVFKSGCIPIYWGHPNVIEDFDSRSFINANDFSSFDELTEYVKKVDNDDELYKSYFQYPIFTEKWLNIFNDNDSVFFKNLAKNILGE